MKLAGAGGAPPGPSERADDWPVLRARRRRWAELLRLVFRVEVEVCPHCGGAARILEFVTEPAAVRRILAHLERRGMDARAWPWVGAAACRGDRAPGHEVVGEGEMSLPGRARAREPPSARWGEHAPRARGGPRRGHQGGSGGRRAGPVELRRRIQA